MKYAVNKAKRIYDVLIKRIVGILAGIIIFVGISQFLDRMYVSCSDYTDYWYPVLWQQFYENEGKIDYLFLGSSHVYHDIDPQIMDQLTGVNNFNLASPSQTMNGSYYLLREADQRNQLSHVYLELYYFCNQEDLQLTDYALNWRNEDYMKWSLNKAAYMLSIGGMDQYINTLFPYTRYRKYLGDKDYIKKTFQGKKEMDFYDYQWEREWADGNGQRLICRKGYCDSTSTFENRYHFFSQRTGLNETSMGKVSEKYFRKIIEYCRKKEIPITLYVAPINDLELISTQGYDNYVTELRELAAEYDLPVYDFNLTKEEYFPIQNDSYYRDTGHLNRDGSKLFTQFFYQAVRGEEADHTKYFYDSYEEKLQALAPTIYGAYYIDYNDAGEQSRKVCVASNRDQGMEYRILITPDEGEQYMVQDFQENKEFYLPPTEDSICTIVARMKDDPKNIVQTMEIYIRGQKNAV